MNATDTLITETLIVDTCIDVDAALELLARSMTGKQYNPGWMRGKTLTGKEREMAACDAYLLLERVKKNLQPAFDRITKTGETDV